VESLLTRLLSIALLLCAAACNGGDDGVRTDAVEVRVTAQDTAWSASYLIGGRDAGTVELPSGREIHLPVGAQVGLELKSRDYICVFAAPDLGLHDFAAPGLPGNFHFRAAQKGSFELRGDEMCGLPHTDKTRGRLVVEEPAAFRAWIRARRENHR
jgi:cytochrome c oxidase subunit 2